MHSKNSSQIAAEFSFPHRQSSCSGFLPLRLTVSASRLDSVSKTRATAKCPSLTATWRALSPSTFNASQSAPWLSRAETTVACPTSLAMCKAVCLREYNRLSITVWTKSLKSIILWRELVRSIILPESIRWIILRTKVHYINKLESLPFRKLIKIFSKIDNNWIRNKTFLLILL